MLARGAVAAAGTRHDAFPRLVSPWLPPHRHRLKKAPAGEPRQETLDTIAAQVSALDELVGLARHSIRVFDVDLSQMGWNRADRVDRLAAFLRRSRTSRLEIIVHDTR